MRFIFLDFFGYYCEVITRGVSIRHRGVFVPQEAMSVRGRVRVDFVRKGLSGYLFE